MRSFWDSARSGPVDQAIRHGFTDRLAGLVFYEQPLACRVDFEEHLFAIRATPEVEGSIREA
jgi:hypothetical protein